MKTVENIRTSDAKEITYLVQETIGGWRQNATFQGTLQECYEYLENNYNNGSFSIVPEWDYEVDYL